MSHLEEELAKYKSSRGMKSKRDSNGKKVRDEGDIMAKLNAFKSKLKGSMDEANVEQEEQADDTEMGALAEDTLEIDNDTDFLAHRLYFPKDNTEEVIKAERDYEVIDPRQRSARAREEEKQRKKQMKPRDGGRGYRR